MPALDNIKSYHIDTSSYIMAVHDISAQGVLSDDIYRARIAEMTHTDVTDVESKHLPILYGYVVQEAVRYSEQQLTGKKLFAVAYPRAMKMIKNNQFIFAEPAEAPPKVDAQGNIKPKKGEKKRLAIATYEANKHREMTRKQWIELLMQEVGLTKGGASTYYANLKSGKMRAE